MFEDSFDLAGEDDNATCIAVIKRAGPHRVTRQQQLLPGLVKYRNRKIAIQAEREIFSPPVIRARDENGRRAGCIEASVAQLRNEFVAIVQPSIENDGAILIYPRLHFLRGLGRVSQQVTTQPQRPVNR